MLAAFKDGVIGNYPALITAAKAGDVKAFIGKVTDIQSDTQNLQQDATPVGLKVCANAG